ncbi:hypothetical protein WJX84_005869 [Apatococcus fuscideae]|uniref:Uncharacterized protein n=1 Tax=Apatococcus fuscideae TaxID=2026836 RepID=A0AAW1T7Y9_9CHLO
MLSQSAVTTFLRQDLNKARLLHKTRKGPDPLRCCLGRSGWSAARRSFDGIGVSDAPNRNCSATIPDYPDNDIYSGHGAAENMHGRRDGRDNRPDFLWRAISGFIGFIWNVISGFFAFIRNFLVTVAGTLLVALSMASIVLSACWLVASIASGPAASAWYIDVCGDTHHTIPTQDIVQSS